MFQISQRLSRCFSLELLTLLTKNTLLVVNFVSLFAGILLVATGSYVKTHEEVLLGFSSSLPLFACLLGIVISIVSVMGCFGSANDEYGAGALRKYMISLSFLILAQILLGVIAYSQGQGIPVVIESAWLDANNANTVNLLQVYFQCCGFRQINDTVSQKTQCETLHQDWALNHPPCYPTIEAALRDSLSSLGAAGLVVGILQGIALIFSAILLWVIRREAKSAYGVLGDDVPIHSTRMQDVESVISRTKDKSTAANQPVPILRTVSTQGLTRVEDDEDDIALTAMMPMKIQ
jgi:hypothetical protein